MAENLSEPSLSEPQREAFNGALLNSDFHLDAESVSALKPVENAQVSFNEQNKIDTPTITPPGGTGNGNSANSRAAIGDSSGNSATNTKIEPGRGRNLDSTEGSRKSGTSISTGREESSGPSAFDQLLSQVMGGAAPNEPPVLVSGKSELAVFKGKTASGQDMNIFMYASYRYRLVSYDQGRLTVRLGHETD